VFTSIGRAAGLDDDITAHVGRHTFVTALIRGGEDLITVAELAGHSRLDTLRIYSQPTDDDKHNAPYATSPSTGDTTTRRRPMLRMLISIALNRNLDGESQFIRCGTCGTCGTCGIIAGQPGSPIRTLHNWSISRRYGEQVMPVEWICPGCQTISPFGTDDEVLPNDTPVRCRRTFLCRHVWDVPSVLPEITCPRCYTTQPGPAQAQHGEHP
jgi:Phage integrase family